MRYINLSFATSDIFESVVKRGCGPNFLLNRLDDFKLMMHTQGIVFLFRFWLSFCFYPISCGMRVIYVRYPQVKSKILINIHKKFLEGTIEDTIQYCLEEVIIPLKISGNLQQKSKNKTQEDVLWDCTKMAFGAALCKLFYDWLKSKKVCCNDNSYWKIPSMYLNKKFKPGVLEEYLVRKWQDHLLLLLGVELKQVPWFLKLLYDKSVINLNAEVFTSEHHVIHRLQTHMQNKRWNILCTDEQFLNSECDLLREREELESNPTSLNTTLFVLSCILQNQKMCIPNNNLKEKTEKHQKPSCKNTLLKCSMCGHTIRNKKNLRKCYQCVERNWTNTRYYCNDSCQMEHWFQVHQEEHRAVNN